MSDTFVYCGRFQPLHNHHCEIIETFLKSHVSGNLILAIISGDSIENPETLADQNFERERNPFPRWTTLKSVSAFCALHPQSHRLASTILPRPSIPGNRKVIDTMLPTPRIWVVPVRNEEWDSKKVEVFKSMGDSVFEIPCDRHESGYELRKRMQSSGISGLKGHIPDAVFNVLLENEKR